MKDWLGNEHNFQCSKGVVTGLVPGPGMGLLGEIKEGVGSIGVMRNEASVEFFKS